MKRSELRADPQKVREWQQRSAKRAKRKGAQPWVPAEQKDRWFGAMAKRCASPTCLSSRRGLQQHHIVYRQQVRRSGGDEWDPRNAITLCTPCHAMHHQRRGAFPLVLLPDEAIEFAFELLGPGAGIYLPRRYSGPVSIRFAELLAATEAAA